MKIQALLLTIVLASLALSMKIRVELSPKDRSFNEPLNQ